MSLDFTLHCTHCGAAVYDGNVTHNLGKMAEAAGIYKALWRPEEIGATTAAEIIEALDVGVRLMREDPAKFRKYDIPNGWGLYEHFLPFVEEVLAACRKHPTATISVSR